MNSGSEKLTSLLSDTVRMLCQNSVDYSKNLRIQGLLVVTADDSHVHVVEISDIFPSQQSTAVGSSQLHETAAEPEVNNYGPAVETTSSDFPPQLATSRPNMVPSFHTRTGARRGRPSLKRRGGYLGFPAGVGRAQPRLPTKRPKVKMEDDIILVDSPDDTLDESGAAIEPKVEIGWADPTGADEFQNMPTYPAAGGILDYQGSEMPMYSDAELFQPAVSRGRGRRSAPATHTITSSHAVDEQLASVDGDVPQDVKPHHMKYDAELDDVNADQSYLPAVGKIFLFCIYYTHNLLITVVKHFLKHRSAVGVTTRLPAFKLLHLLLSVVCQ